MAEDALVLHPVDPEFAADAAALRAALEVIGFLGAPLPELGPHTFRPGGDFLQRVVFLGCSPVVALGEPGATGDSFCRIELPPPAPRPLLVAGSNTKQPRCPACKAPVSRWQEAFPGWREEPLAAWTCPTCGKAASAARLRWRQSAAAARQHIRVWGVFEGEAVPDERLLGALAELGGGSWDHIYARL